MASPYPHPPPDNRSDDEIRRDLASRLARLQSGEDKGLTFEEVFPADAAPVPASHKSLVRSRRDAYERGEIKTVTMADLERSLKRRP